LQEERWLRLSGDDMEEHIIREDVLTELLLHADAEFHELVLDIQKEYSDEKANLSPGASSTYMV